MSKLRLTLAIMTISLAASLTLAQNVLAPPAKNSSATTSPSTTMPNNLTVLTPDQFTNSVQAFSKQNQPPAPATPPASNSSENSATDQQTDNSDSSTSTPTSTPPTNTTPATTQPAPQTYHNNSGTNAGSSKQPSNSGWNIKY